MQDHKSCRRAFWAVLRVGAIGNTENLARRCTIRFIAGIAGGIEAAVGVQLPLLAGSRSQHPTFDRAQVGTDKNMTMCRDDHAAAAIAQHRKRPRVQLAHLLVIAGAHRGNGGGEILDDRALNFAAGILHQPSGR